MSEVKVNKISPRSGTDVTLGDSGDTFTIPSGATINNQGTAVNFGATGSASWVTTVKTGDFTAVAGEGYFVNTTSGAITVTLPASPSAGAVVAVKDYANTFDTNAVTLGRNGSNIGGQALDSTISTEGLAVTLVFVDATKGWLVTDSGLQSELPGKEFVTATGGTITSSGDFKIHTFTGPGTFSVSCVGNAAGSNTVDYLVVAGGGGGGDGGDRGGGGGGAGGYRESPGTASGSYTVSPLGASPAVALAVTATGFPITVGAGGCGTTVNPQDAGNGSNSIFSSITATGGGGGGACCTSAPRGRDGAPGGSGGAAGSSGDNGTSGTGNTPPTTPPQGNNAGNAFNAGGNNSAGGGGGGALAVGVNAASNSSGNGGGGATSSINGTPTARAGGGGGGGGAPTSNGTGGAGGGGTGTKWPGSGGGPAGGNGTVNTGGGGGGTGTNSGGGNGGSGIVIIRYKFQ